MNGQPYRALGHSGLLVSALALGTMTFGRAQWGTDEAESRSIFDRYTDLGGNFIDTADIYADGEAEKLIGAFVAKRALRSRLVIATKSGFACAEGLHRSGGNGARHIHRSVETSLKRLRTDFIDLYWIHVWDGITPAEELLQTMASLVRSGKIRYWGASNTPAWYAAELATLARVRGLPAPIGLQYQYSLVDRAVEREHVPLSQAFGMGLVPWSPLGHGLLTGKYDRASAKAPGSPKIGGLNPARAANEVRPKGDRRLDDDGMLAGLMFTDRNWRIVDELKRVASETGVTPAHAALAWVIGRPGVSSTLIGVSRPEQLTENVAALGLTLSPDHQAALDAVSGNNEVSLYEMSRPPLRTQLVFGGADVRGWHELNC